MIAIRPSAPICKLLFIFLTILFLFYSCKKTTNKAEEITVPIDIADAKGWYEKTYEQHKVTGNKVLQSDAQNPVWAKLLKPNWQKGQAFTSQNMAFVELPATNPGDMVVGYSQTSVNKASKGDGITTLLIIKHNGNYGLYTMTIVADEDYLKANPDKLKSNTYRSRDKDFSGVVLYHKIDGTFINGWRYVNGKVTTALYRHRASSSDPNSSGKHVNALQDCMATIVVRIYSDCSYYVTDVNYEHPFDCTYSNTTEVYYTCTEPTDAPGGGNGGSTTTPTPCTLPQGPSVETAPARKVNVYNPNPTSPTDPTGPIIIPPDPAPCPTGPEPIIVKNDVKGCNGQVINILLNKNLTGRIESIIQNIFNTSDKVNLTFVESTNTQGAPTFSTTTRGATNSLNVEIRVNPTILPSAASQDYKASLIIHEIIHAYYIYKGYNLTSQLKQHQNMANEFISDIAFLLQQSFGTDDENAKALAFGGLKDFANTYPNEYNQLLTENGLTESKRSTDTEFQRAGINGKPCN